MCFQCLERQGRVSQKRMRRRLKAVRSTDTLGQESKSAEELVQKLVEKHGKAIAPQFEVAILYYLMLSSSFL